jgi:hypothetical protein
MWRRARKPAPASFTPPANALDAAELRRSSQNGEDGVIAEILRRIGAPARFFVEFGAEDGREGNCAALAEDGWAGLLIEADPAKHAALAERWRDRPDVRTRNDRLVPETIEDVFRAEQVPAEPAVVSIDVDSIDWYLWEALETFRPRLVVIEYNASLPPGRKLVQPRELAGEWDGTDFFGASLAALEALAERKGYALVHTERHGVNAFFVRSDLVGDLPTGRAALRRPANYFGSGAGHPRDLQNRPWVDLDAGGELVRLDQRASAVVESE